MKHLRVAGVLLATLGLAACSEQTDATGEASPTAAVRVSSPICRASAGATPQISSSSERPRWRRNSGSMRKLGVSRPFSHADTDDLVIPSAKPSCSCVIPAATRASRRRSANCFIRRLR